MEIMQKGQGHAKLPKPNKAPDTRLAFPFPERMFLVNKALELPIVNNFDEKI
ncbi:hypothetical protein GF413_02975 [Candidatus Micrarchaeota archaeon]|nr:hypothetical protein [Candidatus Micrarchaeota archaeon]